MMRTRLSNLGWDPAWVLGAREGLEAVLVVEDAGRVVRPVDLKPVLLAKVLLHQEMPGKVDHLRVVIRQVRADRAGQEAEAWNLIHSSV
jgi:hypothetical protein